MNQFWFIVNWEEVAVKDESEFYHFHTTKYIWKCRLPKWRPFCQWGQGLKYDGVRNDLLIPVITARARAPSQYPKRRLFVRSREVSKPRDWYFKLSYRFEIWQAHRQQCCRSACQISGRSDNFEYKSCGFETLRNLTKRRLWGYWDGAQDSDTSSITLSYLATGF